MEKIVFRNNNTPALNQTNLNKLQDNVEDAINEVGQDVSTLRNSKLDKSSVQNIKTYSDEQTYGCNYINNLNVYSENETVIGMYENKPLYRKVIDFGSLPNTGTKTIQHNISNINEIIKIQALGDNLSVWYFTIPFIPTPRMFGSIGLDIRVSNTEIAIDSTGDMSTSTAKVILEYTKTID